MPKYFEDMETQIVYEMPDDATVEDLNRFLGLLPEPPPPEPKPRDDDDLEGVIPDTPDTNPAIPRPVQEEQDMPALPVEGVEREELPPPVSEPKPVTEARPLEDIVFDHLFKTEGERGSNVTGDVPTGMRGLTTSTYEQVKKKAGDPNMSEEDAIRWYIRDMDEGFSELEGYDKLPLEAKVALLDNGYNLDWNRMMKWRGLKQDMAAFGRGEVTVGNVMENLLNTANTQGKSMRGLAKRRAQAYNVGYPQDKITHVEQTENGINYYKGDKLFFSYNRPRHQDSAIGKIAVD